MTPTLYQRLLGDAWHALPDVLRQVHGTDAQFAASGEMDVTLGCFSGLISNGGRCGCPGPKGAAPGLLTRSPCPVRAALPTMLPSPLRPLDGEC